MSSHTIKHGDHALVFNPAPIQELLIPLFQKKGLRLFVLRGDLVHPIISGNKLWKLKYNLLEVIRQDKSTLVTFGGAYSNHLLAVACAAASLGLKSFAIVRGEEPLDNPVLRQCKLFGMTFDQWPREQYRNKRKYLALLGIPGPNPAEDPFYLIPEGGSNELALEGCAEAVPDLQFDHIFLPVGTGGTLAGFARGAASKQPGAQVEGVAVLKAAEFLIDDTRKFVPGLQNWKMHLDFHHGGYAKSSPVLLEFLGEFASTTGILLDPVYTGKMMFALYHLAASDYFPADKSILAVHTGGLSGWAGFTAKLPQILPESS